MGGPSWIKDGIGIFLVVLCGGLYAAGVTHATPKGDDAGDEVVEAVTRIDVQDCSVASI